MDDELQSETVFGHDGSGTDQYEDSHVMSDRVQAVATNIYREFERMIPAYGEDVVKEMMPHIVTILENLDVAFKENQEKEAELELCKDDNEQLMTQYEREKQLRKSADQKLMAIEDMIDDERKDMSGKIESLQSIVRTFELKAKNAHDHINRLEEKEMDMKKEYSKLHDRYTELLKKHMDHVEKSKLLMGADRMFELGGVSPRKGQGLQMPVLRPAGGLHQLVDSRKVGYEVGRTGTGSPLTNPDGVVDLEQELGPVGHRHKRRTAEKDIITDSIDVKDRGTGTSTVMTPDELDNNAGSSPHQVSGVRGNTSSIFDELLDTDVLAEVDDGADITAVSDNFFGMSKEVENLILENTELLATKNALNVVKDDLIAKVDELTSEQEMLREEVESIRVMKEKLRQRISELEEEVRKHKEAQENEKQKVTVEDEDDILPMAQRKRFTRVEMARVLMERNQYKERLMELQEAVRWTEMIRASREHPDLLPGSQAAKKKSSIWNFFSNLFNSSSNKQPKKVASMPTVRYNAPTSQNRSAESSPRRDKQKINERKKADFLQDEMLTDKKRKEQEQERKEQYKQLRAHVKKEDGRMQAYGWSVPAKCSTSVSKDSQMTKTKGQMPVPVPVYCRPMSDVDPIMKVWCAAGVTNSSPTTQIPEENNQSEQAGSLVWICATGSDGSQVTVVDATNPGSPLDKFAVSPAHILCVACVPGWAQDGQDSGNDDMEFPEISCSEGPVEKSEDMSCNDSNDGGIRLIRCTRYVDSLSATEPGVLPEEGPAEVSGESGAEELKLFQMTMWLGAQNGCVYLHPADGNWKQNLFSIKLPDSVLSINHVRNRVFIALANGSVGIFCRSKDGSWDLTRYYLITLGKPQHSIRCSCVVDNHFIWCGYRNKVHIINPEKLALEKTFDVHPRKESQIRQMVWVSEGVWISIRLDSTLRLYHALTHQHLQDVDIEPYVSKMLGTGKLGFSFVRITSLMAACNRLWIGTGNGVIICVPLSESNKQPLTAAFPGRPGGVFRVYRESPTEAKDLPTSPGSGYIPYCSMAQAQLSFHGHRDAVKFFVVLPAAGGKQQSSNGSVDNSVQNSVQEKSSIDNNSNEMMLVMSGGEGYIDFRVGATNTGDTDEENENTEKDAKVEAGQGKTYLSHLIVWQVYQTS